MSKNNIKSTYDEFLESLSPEERCKHEEGYRDLLLSEMIIAAMENDDVSVRKLAKMANVSPTTVQNLRSGISDSGVKSLFKVFKSLGYSIFAEKGDERLTLVKPEIVETYSCDSFSKRKRVSKSELVINKSETEKASVVHRMAKRK